MTSLAMDVANMVEILPQHEQKFAYEVVKKLVLAWDPDFTKVTIHEAERISKAEESGFINEEDIEWDKVGH